jgi:hypothetical protein
MSDSEKMKVLKHLAAGGLVTPVGKTKYRIKGSIVHVRFCSANLKTPAKFKFNINPNTLSADYELWVCESSDCYYLMPIAFLRPMYDNRNAYMDRHHEEIRVVSVDTATDTVTYATGGQYESIREYRRGEL